jgi:hypothetical protein
MKTFYSIILLFILLFLSGCGLDFYLHPDKKDTTQSISMQLHEKKLAISQIDCISLVGGYYPGLISDDPSVVTVIKEPVTCGDEVYIYGKKRGSAKLCYVPMQPRGEQKKKIDLSICQKEPFMVTVQ